MNIVIERKLLYPVLQNVVGIISNKPRLPILSHILLEISDNHLFITSTDSEIEIMVQVTLEKKYSPSVIAIPGRKFFEICRNIPENSVISMFVKNNKFFINTKYSSFVLSTLSASNFPKTEKYKNEYDIVILQSIFKKMIKLTQFSMGYQDTRYCLNGMYIEIKDNTIYMVATDGYRLAMCSKIEDNVLPFKSVIIPRKGILEILRLLSIDDELMYISISDNCIYIKTKNYFFSSKLIDSVFPNYKIIFEGQYNSNFKIERNLLKQALKRASILANEKSRVISLYIKNDQLTITARNFEQEISEEILNIICSGINMEISFNVDYLLDIINVIDSKSLQFFVKNSISSVQIEGIPRYYDATYVIMPVQI